MSADLIIPTSRQAVLALGSQTLFLLEQAGEIARDILDGRIVAWTEQGWTQRKIAEEIGCSRQAISKRQTRLGIQPSQPHPPRRSSNPVATSENDLDIVDAEVVDGDELDDSAPDRANGQAHQPYDPGPRVRCPTCGHMVKPDDIQVWTE